MAFVPTQGGRRRPQCSQCKRMGHTRKTCYSLHGFPNKTINVCKSTSSNPKFFEEEYQEYLRLKSSTTPLTSTACISQTVNVASLPILPPVRRGGLCNDTYLPRRVCSIDNSRSLQLACTSVPFGIRNYSHQRATIICAAALNARCGAEQTQTVTRQAPTMTHIPGKEKSPQLDDGGTGFPPRDNDDGGGGGGGGGGNWSGGFFFFGFLAFLGFLKDKESEDTYSRSNRRR